MRMLKMEGNERVSLVTERDPEPAEAKS